MTYSWVTPNTRKFMKKGYLTGQSVEQRCEEIANAFESRLLSMGMDDEKASNLATRFLSNLAAGHYSLATPVWVSYGNDRGLPISCFNSDVDDTMDGILYAASEVGMLTKMGGGTSGYLGKIRPRGTPITGNGEADGAAHFARLFNTMMQVSRQGSRRGYFAAYLDAHHGDIMEFLDIGSDSSDIQNITTAVCFNDQFMRSALMGDEQAQKVIAKFHKSRGSHGYPYALFTDNANRGRPKVYKDLDLRINSSNLCVTGDTNILTRDGYKPIESLVGQTIECWNGTDWSPTPIFQTSESQEVLEVVLSNGQTIKATPYHKWYVGKDETVTRTSELSPGTEISSFNTPDGITHLVTVLEVIDNNESLPTYCGTEPSHNKLMFNGVLTGNCNEIMLPSTPDESYVCVLSSMNLVNYDQWKTTDAVELLIYFLDTVVEESIEKLKKLRAKQKYHFLDRIERFLAKHRALGMGVLGYHHLLQSKLIPFESRDAARLNYEVFKFLRERTYTASANLAHWFGEPELLKGYGMRNTTTMAIAPTKSSSFILGNVSEGIQPEIANIYLADLAKETVVVRNPYLERWLISVGKNTQSIWDAIEAHGGAIPETPDFDFVPDNIREVFKTFPQINPKAIIDQAATRQEFIDQGQSLNLIFHPDVTSGEINDLFYYAWKTGIKGLYYQIGMSAVQASNAKRMNMRECVACSA